ncbi:MAG: hypothetical protein ACJAWW_001915 [Sulfurimonas sp.]|jgi:hypothetical protein
MQWRDLMKRLTFAIFVIIGFGLSACSSKNIYHDVYHDDGAYDRANKASSDSLRGLEKDTK